MDQGSKWPREEFPGAAGDGYMTWAPAKEHRNPHFLVGFTMLLPQFLQIRSLPHSLQVRAASTGPPRAMGRTLRMMKQNPRWYEAREGWAIGVTVLCACTQPKLAHGVHLCPRMVDPQLGCFSANRGELTLPKSYLFWPAERAVSMLSFPPARNEMSGPQLNTENLPPSMNHLGFCLLSTGPVPVSLLHFTVLFLPTLLLPEGWLPEVKNNSSRSPKFNFSSSLCSHFPGHRKPYQEVAKRESGLSRANGDELQI